ncbi:MAG TPA: cell division protein FtsA [Syntrophales bacterium]|nr:cell division protein FtsA [Syntrophales bacterium]HQN76841.1 cell division protein FtsA [Syntrophales bacterium]HQQ26663.1 cell division protein FtsA [Syntrophales bacterium]
MARKGNVVVGLDLGTTKTCVIVGKVNDTGSLDIVGIGSCPSTGLRKGVVVNIDNTVESIRKAVEEAELMSDCEIDSVFTGIAGSHIEGLNSHGIVAVKGKEVDSDDVRRAVEAARAMAIPLDREILHVIPQFFIVDNQDGVKDPMGMSGVRLEAKVHVVIASVTSVQNIIKSVNRVGLDVNDVILEPLASSEAVLSTDEKELGVALMDIGGGTTDIAVFAEGSVKHSSVLAVGGNYLTNDIAVGLRTPVNEAEKIKIKYGCSFVPLIKPDETIEVPSVGGRQPRRVSRQILGEIIQPRVEEILRLAHREVIKSGYEDLLGAGIVLTGGTAVLEGITELGEQIFHMPVRRGVPHGIGGLTDVVNSPLYATGVGLIMYGLRNRSARSFRTGEGSFFAKLIQRIKRWYSEFF